MRRFGDMRAMVLVAGVALCGAPMASGAGTMAGQPETESQPTIQQARALFGQQKYGEAAKLYAQITKAQPENAEAWFQLGYCLHVTGNLEEAIPAHKKAAKLAPDGSQFRSLGLYNLGCAYSLRGKTDAAFEALMRAVDAGFHTQQNIAIVSTDSDLDAIRGDARFAEFVGAMRTKARSDTLKQFDFWVGEWDVYNKEGKLVGKSVVEPTQNGLVLVEHWTGAGGGTGRSMNYYEPVGRVWKQVWVDGEGVLETSGKWEDGALRFRGERKMRNGRVMRHKMEFTPDGHGRVRQLIHQSSDGEDWEVYFDGLYVKAGSESPGAWGAEGDAAGGAVSGGSEHAAVLGAWNLTVGTAEVGEMRFVLRFVRGENGDLRGSLSSAGEEMPLSEVALKGERLRMAVTTPDEEVFEFKGTVSGNSIKGVWTGTDGEEFASSGTRADI